MSLDDPELDSLIGGGTSQADVDEVHAIADQAKAAFAKTKAKVDDVNALADTLESTNNLILTLASQLGPIAGKIVSNFQAAAAAKAAQPHVSKMQRLQGQITQIMGIGDQLKASFQPQLDQLNTTLAPFLTGLGGT